MEIQALTSTCYLFQTIEILRNSNRLEKILLGVVSK